MSDVARRPTMDYPGLPGLLSATYVNSQSTAPGIITAEVQPNLDQINYIANIIFNDRSSTMVVPGCRLTSGSAEVTPGGIRATIHFHDRRWTMQLGTISGHYNQPIVRIFDTAPVAPASVGLPGPLQLGNQPIAEVALYPDGYIPQIQEWTKKSARELGELLFLAMGESVYDVGFLPNNEYPEKNWDVSNAARELDTLAEQYGGRFCYNPATDSGGIFQLGEGAQLPDADPGEMGADNACVQLPEPPAAVTIYGAAKRFQTRFYTRAVLPDFDGAWKYIEDASYRPLNGWSGIGYGAEGVDDPGQMPSMPVGYTVADAFALASQWLYRAYVICGTLPVTTYAQGISFPINNSWSFGTEATGFNTRAERKEDIILTKYLNEVAVDGFNQRNVQGGKAFGPHEFGSLNRTPTQDNDRIFTGFDVDVGHQLFVFHQPIYYTKSWAAMKLNQQAFGRRAYYRDIGSQPVGGSNTPLVDPADARIVPTNPVVEVAVMLLDPDNHQLIRWSKTYTNTPTENRPKDSTAGSPGELAIVKEEIRYNRIRFYKDNSVDFNGERRTTDNQKTCGRQADFFSKLALQSLQIATPQIRKYNGLKLIYPDGAIQQVTVEMSEAGCFTVASRNTEHNEWVPPYALRRLRVFGEGPLGGPGEDYEGKRAKRDEEQARRYNPL